MLKRALLIGLVMGCCGMIAPVQGQQFIYKWNNERGQAQYTELPPATGIPYETVRKPSGPVQGTESAARDLAKEQEELAQKLAEEEAKKKEQQEQAQKGVDDVRAKNCEIAKKNVQVLEGNSPVVRTDAKGNKMVLDTQQREAELQKARKDQNYFCNP